MHLSSSVKLRFGDGGPIEHLPWYAEILDGIRWPQYIHARRWGVEFDPLADTDALWALHDGEVAKLRASGVLHQRAESGDEPPAPVESSLLDLKVELAMRLAAVCQLCERRCRADRASGMAGVCGVLEARISSSFLHHGEESTSWCHPTPSSSRGATWSASSARTTTSPVDPGPERPSPPNGVPT